LTLLKLNSIAFSLFLLFIILYYRQSFAKQAMKKFSKKLKKILLISVFWGILSLSFLFFAFLIVLKANGYQINYQNWKIIKTGMIILNGEPKDVTIKMNNKILKGGLPKRISNLSAGTYEITISHQDYQEWSKVIKVDSGLAASFDDIILFKDAPEERALPENLNIEKLGAEYINANRDLTIKDSEIYFRKNLITRFSQEVLAASLYSDNKHIIYQIQNELRIIDLDGSNNKLLINLSGTEPSMFSFRDNGAEILFLDGDTIKAKNIR